MTTLSRAFTVQRPRERAGLGLVACAIGTVASFMLSLLVGLLFAGRVYLSPSAADSVLQRYVVENHMTVQVVAFLQFGSALALAALTCLLSSRLREVAPGQAGATTAVALGGGVAAAFLALNALVQWVLSHTQVAAQPALLRALSYLFWMLGGAGHTAWLGLLVAGASLVALRQRLLPRWLGRAGLVVAGISALSLLTMLTTDVVALIPLGRFPALVWLVATSVLVSGRAGRRAPAVEVAPAAAPTQAA
jgi:hypothetical protein